MDEFALFKGHRYATVVINAENLQVIWVGEGRSRRDIRPFFAWLGDHAQKIGAIVMDMNSAMDLEVKATALRPGLSTTCSTSSQSSGARSSTAFVSTRPIASGRANREGRSSSKAVGYRSETGTISRITNA